MYIGNIRRPQFNLLGTRALRHRKKILIFLTVVIVAVGLGFLLNVSLKNNKVSSSSTVGSNQLKDAQSTQNINHELLIPIKNSKDEKVTEVKYIVLNAEKRDEIVVKGRRATTVNGRDFLIINLKLVNSFNKQIEINTKDFVRLTFNDSTESYAPSIHNDPLTLQAISTQNGRVGFYISESDKNLKLHIGEINGDKKTVDLNF